jgi:hypothetical protein
LRIESEILRISRLKLELALRLILPWNLGVSMQLSGEARPVFCFQSPPGANMSFIRSVRTIPSGYVEIRLNEDIQTVQLYYRETIQH